MRLSRYFASAILATGIAAFGLATSAVAQDAWRIAVPYPGTELMVEQLKLFASEVEARTNGAVTAEIFSDTTLFKQGQEVPAMQRGNLDGAVVNMGDIEQQIPSFSIYNSGYLFRDYDHFRAVFDGEIGDEFETAVYEQMGIKVLGAFYAGTRQLNLREARDVNTPADLAGVKLRMPGAPSWLALGRGLGVTPTPMAAAEMYMGIRTGAIDGQENPLTITRAFKLDEVTKQIVLTHHVILINPFLIAGSSWDALSPENQAIVQAVADELIVSQDTARLELEAGDLDYFREAGLTVTEPDLDAFRESVRAEFEASGIPASWPEGLLDRIAAVE